MYYTRKCLMLVLAAFILVAPSVFASGQQEAAGSEAETESDWPARSIVMIVPFGAGGATDQIGRALKPHMEEILGVPIAVQNMPGGATAVGNEYVFDAPHDGYTVLMEPTDITSIGVMGQSDLTYRDWQMLGVAAAVPNAFMVHPESPIQTMDALENALKEQELSVSVAASGCAWTRGIALYAQEIGAEVPSLVPMGGGRPAAVSALKQEVDLASCGLPEAVDLASGGELNALAYWGESDIELDNGTVIPAITNFYPDFEKYVPFGGWVGMALPADTDPAIIAAYQEAYDYAVSQPEFKEFLEGNFFLEAGLSGQAAQDYVELSTSVNAWLLYDLGIAPNSPEEFDIPRP